MANQRFNLLLLGVFALTALIVALMGVYAVGSYLISQRTKEVGIRIVLGAQPVDLVRMLTGESLKMILAGAVAGALGSFALTRLLRALFFGVSPADQMTFVVALALVVAAALAASYVRARRAARVDPLAALREQ
ncbi:MAG TPA: FtsX-like permease family protein [Candidatus Acidoferrales bacterium]|nr:FtsX-like permease family protein [Candidatus Acidoferrales bacterium]